MSATFSNRPLRILIEGTELDAQLARCAVSAFVRQTLNAPSLAEVSFAEPPGASLRALGYGADLTLRVDADTTLFRGEITTLERQCDGASGRMLRLRAYDKLHRLRKTQRARALSGVTGGDVVIEAANALGLQSDVSDAGPAQSLAIQYEQSDLDFLVELAARSGLHLYLDGEVLRLLSLAGTGEPISLRLGRELATVRATASAETMRRSSQAKAWNVLRTTVLAGAASPARQDAQDMRSLDLSAFGDIGVRTLYNRVAASADETRGLAQADIDCAAADEVVIEASADGDPRLRPGAIAAISGVDDDIDGRFTLTQALHRFSETDGYITEFSTAAPRARPRKRDPVFTFGVVCDVADPDRLSRVRADLPLLGDLRSDWMPVVVPGAGQRKGFAVMPEDGDKVLIVFPDGNPASGIVLGGLYGESEAPGLAPGSPRRFVLRTGNGQSITLDDANALARFETSGGDAFELGPQGSRLHATRDLTIEAPGQTLTIRAKAVEFEEA
jgi:phage protein D/phage baseplate assembly protein gpV